MIAETIIDAEVIEVEEHGEYLPPEIPSMATPEELAEADAWEAYIADEIARPGLLSRPLVGLLDEINRAAQLPRMSWAIDVLDEVAPWRASQIAVVVGVPGAGKTSLAIQIARHNAQLGRHVVFVSAELRASEVGARIISQVCNVSWGEALDGKVDPVRARAALEIPRLRILDVDDATPSKLDRELSRLGPGALVVVDYLQALALAPDTPPLPDEFEPAATITEKPNKSPESTDMRIGVAKLVERLRRMAQQRDAGILVLSQPSRAAGKELRDGTVSGAAAMETGAESAQVERAAYVLVTLGGTAERTDGNLDVELSIAKVRAGVANRVVPVIYDGRRGLFHPVGGGEALSPDEAKERIVEQRLADVRRALYDSATGFGDSTFSRTQLAKLVRGKRTTVLEQIDSLLANGDIVKVCASVGGHQQLCLPDVAARLGLQIAK